MDDSEVNVDRHKIASVMMAAIEEVYPIKISKKYVFQLLHKMQFFSNPITLPVEQRSSLPSYGVTLTDVA